MKLAEAIGEGGGEPSLCLSGLRLWVHGRQFPEAEDYWDGNWLNVTAVYRSPGSRVAVAGPVLHLSEMVRFLAEAENLYASLSGTATLPCIEPNLRIELKGNGRGQIEVEVHITPDQLTESHEYLDTVDQTYLPPLLEACREILLDYPVRGQG